MSVNNRVGEFCCIKHRIHVVAAEGGLGFCLNVHTVN